MPQPKFFYTFPSLTVEPLISNSLLYTSELQSVKPQSFLHHLSQYCCSQKHNRSASGCSGIPHPAIFYGYLKVECYVLFEASSQNVRCRFNKIQSEVRVWVINPFNMKRHRHKCTVIKHPLFTSVTLPFYMNRSFPAIHRECPI